MKDELIAGRVWKTNIGGFAVDCQDWLNEDGVLVRTVGTLLVYGEIETIIFYPGEGRNA